MLYLPHTSDEISSMLQVIGVEDVDELFSTIPEDCRLKVDLHLPEAVTEWELKRHLKTLSGNNAVSPHYKVFLGAGSYEHYIPESVSYLLSRSEFMTSYTPYQPEMSQGTLQAIYEYQTLAARLLGMELATASHYDGATALAESLLMAVRITKKKKIAISNLIHPFYRQVIKTYFRPTDLEIIELGYQQTGVTDIAELDVSEGLAAVAVQSPNFFGCIENLQAISAQAHKRSAMFIVSFTEALAYGLLKSPGSQDADIACGEGQSLGISQSFGGPTLGMLASKREFVRSLPGRLVGQTKDIDGKRGFVLTLATREQHIRREKATSNICTNNSLCALAAAMYMASLGGTGIRKLAALNHDKAEYLKKELKEVGGKIVFSASTFNEFVIKFPKDFKTAYERLKEKNIVAGLPLAPYYPELADHYLLCVTETKSRDDIDTLIREIKL
jgi:glycine dehydrogenase subunit 1